MKKFLDKENRIVAFTVTIFVLIFLISAAGTLQGVKIALEKNRLQKASALDVLRKAQPGYIDPKNIWENDVRYEFNPYPGGASYKKIPLPAGRPWGDTQGFDKEKVLSGVELTKINHCSTTYVNSPGKKLDPSDINDCRTGDNPIEQAIKEFNSCWKRYGTNNYSYLSVYKALCLTPAKNLDAKADKVSKVTLVKESDSKIKMRFPTKCKPAYDKVRSLQQKYAKKVVSKATKDDEKQCKFKGVANCYINVPSSGKGKTSEDVKYECKKKGVPSGRSDNKGGNKGSGDTTPGTTPPPGSVTNTSLGNTSWSGATQPPFGSMPPMGQMGGRGYDPCKDPSFTRRSGMNTWESLLFNTQCLLMPKNDKKDDKRPSSPKSPVCVIRVDKDSVNADEEVKVTWKSTNAQSAVLTTPSGSEDVSVNGERIIPVNSDFTFKLKVKSARASSSGECSKSVTLKSASDSAASLLCSPTEIKPGHSVQLTWSCPNGYSVKESSFGTDAKNSGSKPIVVDKDTEFTLTCQKDDDKSKTSEASCSVSVVDSLADIMVFPEKVKKGDRVRVSWGSLFMDSCSVSGPYGFNFNKKLGVVVAVPFQKDDRASSGDTVSYTLRCKNKWGDEFVKEVTVTLTGVYKTPKPSTPKTPAQPSDTVETNIKTSLDPKQCPHFTRYFKLGDSAPEIRKIQIFLKDNGLYSGPIDSYYSKAVDRAVRAFQARYADEILRPWKLTAPTGKWYKTTRKKANQLAGCAEGAVVLDDGTVVY